MNEIDIKEEFSKDLYFKIINNIIKNLEYYKKNWPEGLDLTDIGNCIGDGIGQIVKENNYWSFTKSDLYSGISHGWSLHDGTH